MSAPEPFAATLPPVSVIPVIRWAGSKRKILPQLAAYWSPHYRRYVEPFAGSCALFLRIQPEAAVLGDLNGGLIEAYEVLRENPDRLHAAVARLPGDQGFYYQLRAQDPATLSAFRRAVRFIHLNRYCFNGIFRTNRAGHFNVPFGGRRAGWVPPLTTFRQCALLFSQARLVHGDFGAVLSRTREGDFVYADPPYAVESRRVFREYGPKEFSSEGLARLARHLEAMDKRGVHFVVSYAECAEARTLFARWRRRRLRVRRHVAGFLESRRGAYELVVTNIPKAAGR